MKVSTILDMLRRNGWFLDRTRTHRQYKHPTKSGVVTVPGKASDDIHPKTLRSILRQAALSDETES
ncbi:MAG TPA: type II toxin-antitoxin system HicA family toxin [Sporichthyaceae bacterium]|jgi:predicted RNA binding protein YcfA (HicA-like mRNA interferase family)|nr:type II toxin-antitoxin system HicA family toxin [Sporichthyaceae bacterium]